MADQGESAGGDTSLMIEMEGVNKWFGDFQVLSDINLQVRLGEKVVVCGPSGSGKSTMIRCINRLEVHQEGRIVVEGIELTDDMANVTAIRREVGMVFQQFNLFPHLSVLQNLSLAPMRSRKMSGSTSPNRRTNIPTSSPAASSSGWRSPARCA
jgi:ABC-type polar amino acid transport system ATPase subunit